MLKNIVKDLKPSSTLAINEASKKLEDEGKKIFKFGFGQSPFKVPQDVVEELKNNAYQNKYLPMQGLSELRQSVAKYTSKKKNYEYNSENVIIGPGSKELMFLLHVIFDGEIILPAPSWVSYAPQAILGRNKIQILQTKRENNWFPTAQEIEEVILKDKNKNYLLFLNSPNNPSGQVCENLEEISNVANILYFVKKKKNNSIILNFDENSDDLFKWYQQLVGESLGKKQKGIFPFISTMPKDNHSLMQLYLDGPQKNFFTFFGVSEKKSNKIINSTILETFSFIKNKKFSQILDSQRIATQKVFNNMNIPFRSFEIKRRNEETLGELFTFFILETILLGKCLKINPYDQPAVELIKKSTKKTLLNF